MGRLRLTIRLLVAAVLVALGCAAPAAADSDAGQVFAPRCHAVSDSDRRVEAMIDRAAWNCTGTGWQANQPVRMAPVRSRRLAGCEGAAPLFHPHIAA